MNRFMQGSPQARPAKPYSTLPRRASLYGDEGHLGSVSGVVDGVLAETPKIDARLSPHILT